MRKTNKKGFTLTELIVVIVIIGILIAVLIPLLTSYINRSRKSSDNQLVKNLNLALSYDETTLISGEKHQNMTEALEATKKSGYDVSVINATARSNEILWDSVNDVFCYFNDGNIEYIPEAPMKEKVKDYQYFVIKDIKTEADLQTKYSIYLRSCALDAITVSTGIDSGELIVPTITYSHQITDPKDAQTVIICTNGGTLIIDAESDTVNHYGEGLVLDIKAIAGSSYHEYGHFPKASIAQGRIVVEEEGNIPSVEVTAVPTAENPIKVETNKDIVVSASPEVVEALGTATLENVEVKVTSAEAAVVVDEKINTEKVEAAGKTSDDLVSITKVSTFSELSAALAANKPFIMFTSDISYATNGSGLLNITYNVTIDGNGHTLSGYGKRGSNNTTIAANNGGSHMIDVAFSNLKIENNGSGGRPIETRGNINSLTISNCELNCRGTSGYMQALTIGGSQATNAKITIRDSKIYSPKYYGIITFNPVDLVVEDSEFECWAALYMKSPDGSIGSRGSKVSIDNSKLICVNNNSGYSNDFGAIVFEDGSIEVEVKNTSIDVTEKGDASQSAVLFNSGWASIFGTILKEVKVSLVNVNIKGNINDEEIEYDSTNVVIIQSGATTNDPSAYLADGSTVTNDGLFYNIENKKGLTK